MLPNDVKAAELEVIRAASRTTVFDARDDVPLRKAVQDMTRILKEHGLPPERALVYLKGAAFKARLSYGDIPGEGAEHTNDLLAKTLEWFLEAYYDDVREPVMD